MDSGDELSLSYGGCWCCDSLIECATSFNHSDRLVLKDRSRDSLDNFFAADCRGHSL